jgi:hypothetical protein
MASAAKWIDLPAAAHAHIGRRFRRGFGDTAVVAIDTLGMRLGKWHRMDTWRDHFGAVCQRLTRFVRWSPLAIALTTILFAVLALSALSVTAAITIASPAILLGTLCGYYVLAIFQILRVKGLSHRLPQAFLFSWNGRQIEVTPAAIELRKYCSPLWQRSLAAVFAALAATMALLALQIETHTFALLFRYSFFASVESLLAWVGPVALTCVFMAGAGTAGAFQRELMARVRSSVTAANVELKTGTEIEGHLLALDISCGSMRADPGQRYRRAFRDYAGSRCRELVLRPEMASSFVRALKVVVADEARRTQDAVQRYQNALMQFRELRGCARSLQETVLRRAVDGIGDKLALCRKQVELQDFEGLTASLRDIQAEMQSLDAQLTMAATARSESRQAAAAAAGASIARAAAPGPYEQLGVTKDISSEQLRRLRTRLVQIYHPDALDGAANAARMAEINAAVDLILKWRGEK